MASGYGFTTEAGVYPASAPEQKIGGAWPNDVSAQVKFGEGTQLESGEYDLWVTWKPRNDLGTGKITLQVQDDFTRANPDSVFNSNVIGNATWGWGMVRDGATGTYVRTSDPQKVDTIPIAFLVAPKYLHDDGLRWFHVGTIHLDSLSKVKMNIEDDEGVVALDAFKMTPHVAKEVIEYDHANRAVHSKVYSELTDSLPTALNPTGVDLARTETFYAYDVAGHLVATRNVERVGSVQASGSQYLLEYMDETPTTVGYAYQGNQQLLSFGLDESTPDYLKIKSFHLIGTSGDVLAVDPTSSGQPTQAASDQHSIWQFNNLDGTRFVDSQSWLPSDYAFAGQKLQSASSDFLLQSRDAGRTTWGGGDGASFQSGGLIDRFANMDDTTMVLGTVGVSAVLAIGIVATAPVSVPALTAGQLAFRAGGAASGGAASAISEYQRGGDAMSILAAGMGGAGSGGLNPFSGYGALAGGAAGAAGAVVAGSDVSAGFQWGEMVGSFAGGAVGHYGTALAKYTAGGHGARAAAKAFQHTAGSMLAEGVAMGAGAGIGAYYGGYDGALAGAQLGQLAGGVAANFLVACFTAGTPIVVDLDGNSRLIEELEVGDVVLSRNEFDPTGPLELKRIEEKFVRTAAVMELTVRGRSIKTTAEHPFYVPAQGKFVPAGELNVGDELVGHSGEIVRIDSVSPLGEIATVYNIRVADHHTYFVGGGLWQFDVWVHNQYTRERGFNNGSRIVEGSNGDRWYLPARYRTTRQVNVMANADRYGNQLQDKATELANGWSAKMLSKRERRAINGAWTDYNATHDSKFLGKALILQAQAKGRYIERKLKAFASTEGMELQWRTGQKGIDAYDGVTGVYYEILSGSERNIRAHANRDGMTQTIWRLISF